MYKVTLSGSYNGQEFRFRNYDDAFNFASMAVEFGTYEERIYKMENGVSYVAPKKPVPVAVTIVGVDE